MISTKFALSRKFLNNSFKAASRLMARAPSDPSLIGVIQLNSTHDVEANWKSAEEMIRKSKRISPNVEMLFLPECFDFIGRNKEEAINNATTEDSDYIGRFRNIAKELGVWLSLGGFHEKATETRCYNSHLIIDSNGHTISKYRKLHLFDLDIPNKIRVKETDITIPGDSIIAPIKAPCGYLGLSTCYDLRFPHLASILRSSGAEILAYPSAFTVATGMDHWEVLLRAQAITTQCYVVASAQTGKHTDKRSSFGHAMVVDPWGAVIAQCSEGPGVCFAPIDLNAVQRVRRDLPCFNHRRLDLYDAPALLPPTLLDPDSQDQYPFGHVQIPKSHVFLRSNLSVAFVNIKPVLTGHVLVSPLREVAKFTDLSPVEVSDLFRCVQLIEKQLESFYALNSTTISVQDGPHAGQSVKHVHVHVIPRQANDLGDEIYRAIAKHDQTLSEGVRSSEEMAQEAQKFRALFYR